MNKYLVPLKKPDPNIDNLIDIIKGKIELEKPPLFEYVVDDVLRKKIFDSMLIGDWVDFPDIGILNVEQIDVSKLSQDEIGDFKKYLDNLIIFNYYMGYDYVRLELSLTLPIDKRITADTAKNVNKSRLWQETGKGVILNWDDFEKFPWPVIKDTDFFAHEYIINKLPDGMGFISNHCSGIYEHTARLMGYEELCLKLFDDIELVEAVINKLDKILTEYTKRLLEFDRIVAIFQGEDLGFKGQTLLQPEILAKHFLPWHKKISELTHGKDKIYILHSCGNVESIMDYLIDEVKIDALHSFEDICCPIIDYKKKYGDKVALLGGIDVDKLSRFPEYELRKYVRNIIKVCSPGGKFAVGSGSSVPSYIPLENYLIMMDESLR